MKEKIELTNKTMGPYSPFRFINLDKIVAFTGLSVFKTDKAGDTLLTFDLRFQTQRRAIEHFRWNYHLLKESSQENQVRKLEAQLILDSFFDKDISWAMSEEDFNKKFYST